MFRRASFVVGTVLVRIGTLLRDRIREEEEADDNDSGGATHVELGETAERMLYRGRARRGSAPVDEPEKPLKGSLQDRFGK